VGGGITIILVDLNTLGLDATVYILRHVMYTPSLKNIRIPNITF